MEVHLQKNDTTELKTSFSDAMPEPEFKTVGESFQVTVFSGIDENKDRNSDNVNVGVNVGVNQLTEIIKIHPGIKTKELQPFFNVTERTIERWLQQLRNSEVIEFRGAPKTGGYFLTEKHKNT